LAIGAFAIIAAWFYTGGKSPYGYAALGEVSVFIFFGLVATLGTEYIQTREFDANGIFGGVAMGAISSAVLMVNNIRDIDLDRNVNKRTLAVRVGKKWANAIFIALIWVPIIILLPFPFIYPATVFAYASVLLIAPATLIVLTAKTPRELILVLKLTSFAGLIYGALLGFGLAAVSI
jgi:1,4-dihydroxy-2-naphthoate octaprenyltransferase